MRLLLIPTLLMLPAIALPFAGATEACLPRLAFIDGFPRGCATVEPDQACVTVYQDSLGSLSECHAVKPLPQDASAPPVVLPRDKEVCTPSYTIPAPQAQACASRTDYTWYCYSVTLDGKTLAGGCRWFLGP